MALVCRTYPSWMMQTCCYRPCLTARRCVLGRQARLAGGGLALNLGKCLFVAQKGRTFSDAERDLMARLGKPWIDASTAPIERGSVTVGVPFGDRAFVEKHLQTKLFDSSLWQYAWHLSGLGEADLSAAFSLFMVAHPTHGLSYMQRGP